MSFLGKGDYGEAALVIAVGEPSRRALRESGCVERNSLDRVELALVPCYCHILVAVCKNIGGANGLERGVRGRGMTSLSRRLVW